MESGLKNFKLFYSMDTKQIIIFSAAMAFLAFRLYQKYYKKNNSVSSTEQKNKKGTTIFNSSKDDDYEPYSKK
jgi:sortase (surface protein transpeptidase)